MLHNKLQFITEGMSKALWVVNRAVAKLTEIMP